MDRAISGKGGESTCLFVIATPEKEDSRNYHINHILFCSSMAIGVARYTQDEYFASLVPRSNVPVP